MRVPPAGCVRGRSPCRSPNLKKISQVDGCLLRSRNCRLPKEFGIYRGLTATQAGVTLWILSPQDLRGHEGKTQGSWEAANYTARPHGTFQL